MIQRKQTLFLFESVFLSIALLFIPAQHLDALDIYLIPVTEAGIISSMGHFAAIGINFAGLVLAFATIFLYRKRGLQVTLSYVLSLIWVILTLMIAMCPFAENASGQRSTVNYFAVAIGIFGILAGFLAARFIKKDIELLKSADRIR